MIWGGRKAKAAQAGTDDLTDLEISDESVGARLVALQERSRHLATKDELYRSQLKLALSLITTAVVATGAIIAGLRWITDGIVKAVIP